MDGSFHSPWQERWSGLAHRLEAALENNAYRFLLCCATVVFVIAYATFASRIAEPPRFIESRLVKIEEGTEPLNLTPHDLDLLNRSIIRMQKLSNVLGINPQRLSLRPSIEMIRTKLALENHVLRLWIDETRGFASGGMYEMTSEAIARAILAVTFREEHSIRPAVSDGWFEQVKNLDEMCTERRAAPKHSFMSSWMSLCNLSNVYGGHLASPMSLSPWLASQLIAESAQFSTGARIQYLRELMQASANPEILEFERANRWPSDGKKFGPLLREIMTKIAPKQAIATDFRATLPWLQVTLGPELGAKTRVTDGLHVGLLVVTSCRAPRLVDFKGFDAREVVWAQVCPKSLSSIVSLVSALDAEQFAERNPDVSFVQLGVAEISYALEHGWIDSKTDITDFVIGSKRIRSRVVAYQVRPQSEEWNPKAQAFRVKAPIEVLKLLRLRAI